MSASASPPGEVVGIQPWLPWPLSGWSWWTDPVRAERLAALRIAVAACLIFDIAYNYAPHTLDFFGKDGLANPEIFNWRFRPPRMVWSLLRGVADEVTHYLALTALILTTLWITGTSLARLLLVHKNPPPNDRTGYAIVIWTCALAWYVLGLWSHMIATNAFAPPPADVPNEDASLAFLAWVAPLLGFTVVCLFHVLDIAIRLRDPEHRIPWVRLGLALLVTTVLAGVGLQLSRIGDVAQLDRDTWWLVLLRSWQEKDQLVVAFMVLWVGCAVLLLMGLLTRFAAVMSWMLSLSFMNTNYYLDNAGDTIRIILLFYLMLCPCGAVWSVDALFRRRAGPVYVHPWPLRLIFMQMIFVYWMNGLYKLFGPTWLHGNSLFYVLGDMALTRFSQTGVPIPHVMTRIMTWSVLAWEVSFPLLVIWKWPRRFALFMGVMFHLGILATMELAMFVPYALCMYVPLLPWGEWFAHKSPAKLLDTAEKVEQDEG
jgi:hypothetical protein